MQRRMQQTTSFVGALKRCLKARGLTYADLARALGLSEATVKRCFSLESLTLQRTEQILTVLDMTMLDVAKLAAAPSVDAPAQLTIEQEKALAERPRLFSFFHLLLFGHTAAKIVKEYDICKEEAAASLRTLERLQLLEVMPRDKVRLLVTKNLIWRPQGPLRQAYDQSIRERFLDNPFAGNQQFRKFATRRLSQSSQALLLRKIKRLVADMDSLSEVDSIHGGDGDGSDDAVVSGLLVAFRSFELDNLLDLQKRRAVRTNSSA